MKSILPPPDMEQNIDNILLEILSTAKPQPTSWKITTRRYKAKNKRQRQT